QALGLDPLAYMRKYGAFQVLKSTYERHERVVGESDAGVTIDGKRMEGFPTPSRKQELYSPTMVDWGWPEYSLPGYIESHIDSPELNTTKGEFCLLPTFRLPTLIHTRSGAAKWLNEIAQCNPLWMHPSDAGRLNIA